MMHSNSDGTPRSMDRYMHGVMKINMNEGYAYHQAIHPISLSRVRPALFETTVFSPSCHFLLPYYAD
jgi:hypothetical protein